METTKVAGKEMDGRGSRVEMRRYYLFFLFFFFVVFFFLFYYYGFHFS